MRAFFKKKKIVFNFVIEEVKIKSLNLNFVTLQRVAVSKSLRTGSVLFLFPWVASTIEDIEILLASSPMEQSPVASMGDAVDHVLDLLKMGIILVQSLFDIIICG